MLREKRPLIVRMHILQSTNKLKEWLFKGYMTVFADLVKVVKQVRMRGKNKDGEF